MPESALSHTDHELEVQSTDTTQYPYIKQRGMLNWSSTANSGAGGWSKFGKLIAEAYDYIAFTYPAGDATTLTFKLGGSGGTTVATLALVYTNSNKDNLLSVTKA